MANVLWQVSGLNYAIGTQVLFDHAELALHENERVALIGRNGCGKSTLLSVILGTTVPSGCEINRKRDLRVGTLTQDFLLPPESTVREVLEKGTQYFRDLIIQYEKHPSGEIESILNFHDAWHLAPRIDQTARALHLPDPDRTISTLSGGEKRRTALAAAVVAEPDLLLLDEPTNHLDIEAIEWIEDFLSRYRGAALFVTHDRYFLDRIATRVVELDRGKFYSSDGGYADFLAAKEERIFRENTAEEKRQKFLRSEIDWVRRSPKARLKRNQGRLNRFNEIAARSAPVRIADIEPVIPYPDRLGDKCIELQNLTASCGNRILFEHLDLEISPGTKLGIVGPNGCGKSTLLSILTGERKADKGSVKVAEAVRFNHIDQYREKLDLEKSVYEEISAGVDHVELNGEKISVRSYLRRYLFEDERINTKIRYLSGGERARLILAKQFKYGGNVLVIDEPTNDLDLSSLRMLEEALAAFSGTVIVVSHDRYFLNRFCDAILGISNGETLYTLGDYDDHCARRKKAPQPDFPAPEENKKTVPSPKKPSSNKRTFKENRELAELEEKIPALENAIAELENRFSLPDFFARYGKEQPKLEAELTQLKAALENSVDRWAYLAEKE
ncbi:MAG: ABC-F family ATP-binding cassette domain-containing protein [Victivallaceae bacterium]|nr:ABC-F family ATP-binding cassette domain-containing protein [Victivallaceae bacterium]